MPLDAPVISIRRGDMASSLLIVLLITATLLRD
jgi:hypothetical protein